MCYFIHYIIVKYDHEHAETMGSIVSSIQLSMYQSTNTSSTPPFIVVMNSQKKAAILNSDKLTPSDGDSKSLLKTSAISLLKTNNNASAVTASAKTSSAPSIIIKQNPTKASVKVEGCATRVTLTDTKSMGQVTSIAPATYTVTRLSSTSTSPNKAAAVTRSIVTKTDISRIKSVQSDSPSSTEQPTATSTNSSSVDVSPSSVVIREASVKPMYSTEQHHTSMSSGSPLETALDISRVQESSARYIDDARISSVAMKVSEEIKRQSAMKHSIEVTRKSSTLPPIQPIPMVTNPAPLVSPLNLNTSTPLTPVNPIPVSLEMTAPIVPKPINPTHQGQESNPFFPTPRPLPSELSTRQANIAIPTPLPPHSLANPYAPPPTNLHPSNPLTTSSMLHHNLPVPPSALPPSLSTPLAPTAYQPYQNPTQPMYQQHPWSSSSLAWNQQYATPQYPPQYPSYPGYANPAPAYPTYQQPAQTPADWFSAPGYPSTLSTPTPQYPSYNPPTALYHPVTPTPFTPPTYPPSSYTLPPQPGQQQPTRQTTASNFLGMLEDPNNSREQPR